MTHGGGRSDPGVVAVKPANKAEPSAAESGEQGRGPRGMRTNKAHARHRTGKVCHKRWPAYDKLQSKGRRNGSPRFFTTSASICSGSRSSHSRRTRHLGSTAWHGGTTRQTSRTCTTGTTGERIGHSPVGDNTYQKPMDDSVRLRSALWKTKSSRG